MHQKGVTCISIKTDFSSYDSHFYRKTRDGFHYMANLHKPINCLVLCDAIIRNIKDDASHPGDASHPILR